MTRPRLPSGTIIGLYAGKVEERWPGKARSAIGKTRIDGPLRLEAEGFTSDEQADRAVHGGPEKAVHHYASEHMTFWRGLFVHRAERFVPGCFGENVSTEGLTEDNLCLGDLLSLGTAVVQICQGRQPCWKLNAHMELDAMAVQFQKFGRTGWYYRVVEPGDVRTGDSMTVIGRPCPDWPLNRLIPARFDPCLDPVVAAELSRIVVLSASWRAAFARKAGTDFVENTDKRLKG